MNEDLKNLTDEEDEELIEWKPNPEFDISHPYESQLSEEIGSEEDVAENPPEINSAIENTMRDWENYNSVSPELSGEDIDAYWQGADNDGSETSGGHAPTPDQDIVEDIAEPWGLSYTPTEEINLEEKLATMEEKRESEEGWDERKEEEKIEE
jgi:hypothetical protein